MLDLSRVTCTEDILPRQRVAVDVQSRSTHSVILGKRYAMPVAIAPTGLAGIQHADGEILGALAA
jgi:L-lactate dehydrogenase (cytochrome)